MKHRQNWRECIKMLYMYKNRVTLLKYICNNYLKSNSKSLDILDKNKVELWLFLFSILLHVCISPFFEGVIDAYYYVKLAENFVAGKGWTVLENGSFKSILPGYPILISIIGFFSKNYMLSAELISIVFNSIGVIYFYKISYFMFRKKDLAIFSGMLYLFEPVLLSKSIIAFTEGMATALLFAGFYYYLRFINNKNNKNNLIISIIFLMASCLTRGTSLPVLFVCLFISRKDIIINSHLKRILLFSLIPLTLFICLNFFYKKELPFVPFPLKNIQFLLYNPQLILKNIFTKSWLMHPFILLIFGVIGLITLFKSNKLYFKLFSSQIIFTHLVISFIIIRSGYYPTRYLINEVLFLYIGLEVLINKFKLNLRIFCYIVSIVIISLYLKPNIQNTLDSSNNSKNLNKLIKFNVSKNDLVLAQYTQEYEYHNDNIIFCNFTLYDKKTLDIFNEKFNSEHNIFIVIKDASRLTLRRLGIAEDKMLNFIKGAIVLNRRVNLLTLYRSHKQYDKNKPYKFGALYKIIK